jgi:long-chain acyl-CoA synthetase
VFTICYTSGTTGNPKGVQITHRNVIAAAGGLAKLIPKHLIFSTKDSHLSFLPLSHMFERVVFHTLSHYGCRIGFYQGDINVLLDDLATLKPTLFPCVPRLLNKLYDGIQSKVSGGSFIARNLFHYGFNRKYSILKRGTVTKNTMWDKLIFARIQERIGGKVRMMLTGAAPISSEVLEFMRVSMGCFVVEGYGQTESCAAGFITQMGDHCPMFGSNVGVPFSSIEYKLVDAPQKNYFVTDSPNPRGEICMRGPLIMKGYYKNPEKTRETIDQDGWLHTGDVGEILPNRTLRIIDRVNNIFKLSQGEFVAPELIENKIKSPFVAQLYVHGDPFQPSLVVIAIVDASILQFARTLGLKETEPEVLIQNQLLQDQLLKHLQDLGRKNGLKGYEIPKGIHLDTELFTVANGLLTPTFKTKRNVVKEKYSSEIAKIYHLIS